MAEYDQKDTKKELTAILEMPDYQESVEMLRRDIKIISEKAGKQPQDVEFMLRGNGVKRNILVGNFGRTFLQLCYKELDKELDERIKHLPAYLHEVIYKIAAWRKVMPHALSKPEEGHVQAAQTR